MCTTQNKFTTLADEILSKQPVVAVKRSSTLDYWASQRKVAKMDTVTMIIPSTEIVKTLNDFGINFDEKWTGWNCFNEDSERKICELQSIINYTNPISIPTISLTHNPGQKDQIIPSTEIVKTLNDFGINCDEKWTGWNFFDEDSERKICELNKIINDTNLISIPTISLTHNPGQKDQVFNNDRSSQSKSVSVKRTSESVIQSEEYEEDFLGFDFELGSGTWRGWEKPSFRNAKKLKEITKNLKGSRDLEHVLRETELAVSGFVEELDKYNKLNEDKMKKPNSCNVTATIQSCLKDLMAMFSCTAGEPPMSYKVLTVMAICANPEQASTIDDICRFIKQHFPFYNRGGLNLRPLIEMILDLGSCSTFTCQKSRRPTITITYWKVDSAIACGILQRAVNAARHQMRKLADRHLMKNPVEECSVDRNLQGKAGSQFRQRVIIDGRTLKSPNKSDNSGVLSPSSKIFNEEIEIIDIDPCLQTFGENTNNSNQDDAIAVIDDKIEAINDEVIVIDDDDYDDDDDVQEVPNLSSNRHDKVFSSEETSIKNKEANEVCDKTFTCSFLQNCHNFDSENKQFPCYICHTFYLSNDGLNTHLAKTHFGKDNVHKTSPLCKEFQWKSKSNKLASRHSMEKVLFDLQSKGAGGVLRYKCSKCNAIFHKEELLNLHVALYHEDTCVQESLMPLKQVSTPEGSRFYYCDQCSGCFHTEKALLVHTCIPFSRDRS